LSALSLLLKRERRKPAALANFDALGALLVTGGMLLPRLRAREGT
jgi:hypothetical protein